MAHRQVSRAVFVALALLLFSHADAAPLYLLHVTGDPGDAVSLGQTYTFTPDSGLFSTVRGYDRAASVTFSSPTHFWAVVFAAPYEDRLTPGLHEGLPRYPFQSPSEWALNVTGDGRSCPGALSRFDVKQVRYDSTGRVTLLHALFEQHCNAAPAGLYGTVVFNADTSLYIVSPQDVFAFPSTPVVFDVTATDAHGDAVTLSATGLPPGATFMDYGGGSGRFEWPSGAASPGTFVITVNAEDSAGRTTSMETVLRIHGPDFIRLDSDPGHFVTQSRSYFFNDANSMLSRWANASWAASARAVTPEDDFQLAFAAPYPRPLGAGRHLAQSAPAGEYSSALALDGDHRACNVATGWFDVRQVVFGGAGQVSRLWVVFEHHCEGSAPAVRGEVRINADTSVYVLPPADAYILTGTDTSLAITGRDTRGHSVVLTAVNVPSGCSFADHGDGTAELRLTTQLATSGDYPIAFTCANGLGNQATATTYLHVRQRPADAPIPGQGADLSLQGAMPNPSSSPTVISFALPDDASAQLELVDLAGRSVWSRKVGQLGSGSHRVSLGDTRSLRAGFYWIRLRHRGRALTKSMILFR